jgi:hypothetical protein
VVDGTNSGLCPIAGLNIVESYDSATTVFVCCCFYNV